MVAAGNPDYIGPLRKRATRLGYYAAGSAENMNAIVVFSFIGRPAYCRRVDERASYRSRYNGARVFG